MLDAALRYARMGMSVLPLRERSKVPVFKQWPETATKAPDLIHKWWAQNPNYNIGIATGIKSGVFVLDVDPKNGGNETLEDLVWEHGSMPSTWCDITGSGGLHYYFRLPNFVVRNHVNLWKGIDIRGEGGQVVAPPSIHPDTGKSYEWDGLEDISKQPIADAPAWILDALEQDKARPEEQKRAVLGEVPLKIPSGTRHMTLLSIAGHLRRMGLTGDEIYPTLELINRTRCDVPKPDQEVRQIAASMMRYQPSDTNIYRVSNKVWSILRQSEEHKQQLQARLSPVDAISLLQKPLREPEQVLDGILHTGLTMLAGRPKSGKAQPVDSMVVTPTGWRAIGDIRPGDVVTAPNGTPEKVIAIHPQGVRQVYRVQLSDGTSVRCTSDHLWKIQSHRDRVAKRSGRVVSTAEIRSILTAGGDRETYLPTCSPIDFEKGGELPVDPYILGLLIGDGGLTKHVTFTKSDWELHESLWDRLPQSCRLSVRSYRKDTSAIASKEKGRTNNVVLNALRSMGLHTLKSHEKFIPSQYLVAPLADRIELLRGLLDTDGEVSKDGKQTGYSTSSLKLAVGIRELVLSLGGTCSITEKEVCKYTHNGEKRNGRPSFRLAIKVPAEIGCPFRLERKAKRWQAWAKRRKRDPLRSIVSVTADGFMECVCITVDNPEGLYITENYTVTHNSWFVLQLAIAVATGADFMGAIAVRKPGRVGYLALEESENRTGSRLRRLICTDSVTLANIEFMYRIRPLFAGGAQDLEEYIAGARPEVMVIDTLLALVGNKRNDDVMRRDYAEIDLLRALAHKYGTAILLVHHLRKDSQGQGIDAVAGTTGVTAAADCLWTLQRRPEGQAALDIVGREVEDRTYLCKLDLNSPAPGWQILASGKDAELSEERRDIMDLLESDGPLKPSKIASVLRKNEVTIRRLLQNMLAAGNVWRNSDGAYRIGR